jgi:hypothetical protein
MHSVFDKLDNSIQRYVEEKLPSGKAGVYAIGHLNSTKLYIGKGCNGDGGPTHRIKQHLRSKESKCVLLHNAVRLHGPSNFKAAILKVCEPEEVNGWERFLIAAHKSMKPNGYNLTAGGDGGALHPDSMKKRMDTFQDPHVAQNHRNAVKAGIASMSKSDKIKKVERFKESMRLPEARKRKSKNSKKIRQNTESERKRVQAFKSTCRTQSSIEKRRVSNSKSRTTPEYKEKRSSIAKNQWKDHGFLQAFANSLETSNAKKTIAANLKLKDQLLEAENNAVAWPSKPKDRQPGKYYKRGEEVGKCSSGLKFISLSLSAIQARRAKTNRKAAKARGVVGS